jgi:eukaryotic-like serine/threonine-protein kinase
MPMPLEHQPPTAIGDKYQVVKEIGRGGFGAVYQARNPQLNKMVAIKVLHATLVMDPNMRARFEQEARAGAGLAHPNLIPVFDYGFTEYGEPFLVMEYVDGVPLSDFVQKRTPSVDELIPLLMQVAKALRYLHENKIVHRDLKTSNVLVQDIGGERYARLLDLGIAKVFAREDTAESKHLTSTGMVFGSPMYMSPEQCEGRPVDPRSDIYSFGCVIYECLSGRCPFDGDNSLQVIIKHLQQPPDRLEFTDRKQAALGAVAERCLQKEPDKRFQSMGDLLNALQQVLELRVIDKVSAKTSSMSRAYMSDKAPNTAAPDSDKRGGLIAIGIVAVLLLLAIPAVMAIMNAQKSAPSQAAAPVETKPAERPASVDSAPQPTASPPAAFAPQPMPASATSAETTAAQEAMERMRQERLAAEKAALELQESQRKLAEETARLEQKTREAREAAEQAHRAAQAPPAVAPGMPIPGMPIPISTYQQVNALKAASDERFRLTTEALRQASQNINSGNDQLRRLNERNANRRY